MYLNSQKGHTIPLLNDSEGDVPNLIGMVNDGRLEIELVHGKLVLVLDHLTRSHRNGSKSTNIGLRLTVLKLRKNLNNGGNLETLTTSGIERDELEQWFDEVDFLI